MGGGGGWGHCTLWFLPYNAVCSDDSFFIFIFYKGQVKSPILHNTRDGSEFYVLYLSHYSYRQMLRVQQ